ncbi:hypothetical protein ACFPVT_10150 [Corynebacterium choanae]|nr:hypothetical protein [Corynebacterium choanae]
MLAPTKAIAAATAITPYAHASEVGDDGVSVQKASAPAPAQNVYAPRDTDGASWAPGGAGATNWLYVKGDGLNVRTAAVAYMAGSNMIQNNACVDEFEIAYYENGQRITETAGSNCAVGRVTHRFDLYKDVDAHTPFCGRVRVGENWGNYACINILP